MRHHYAARARAELRSKRSFRNSWRHSENFLGSPETRAIHVLLSRQVSFRALVLSSDLRPEAVRAKAASWTYPVHQMQETLCVLVVVAVVVVALARRRLDGYRGFSWPHRSGAQASPKMAQRGPSS